MQVTTAEVRQTRYRRSPGANTSSAIVLGQWVLAQSKSGTIDEHFVSLNEQLCELQDAQLKSAEPLSGMALALAFIVNDALKKTTLPATASVRQVALPEGGIGLYIAAKSGKKRLASIQCLDSGELVAVFSDRATKASRAVAVQPDEAGVSEQLDLIGAFLNE